MNVLLWNVPCVACIVAAGAMACHNADGWGWFLFVALLLARFPAGKTDERQEIAEA